jgi:putative hemolysin
MLGKWIAWIAAGAASALVLSACASRQVSPTSAPTPTPGGGAQIANPAATYCVEKGYVSEIRTAPDGSQYGVCIFPDGTECEEWALFRGECGPGAKPTATPVATQTVSVPEIGLSFTLPASWQRRGNDRAWAPLGDSTGYVGVAWHELQPGQEPESILPDNAQMLGRTEGPQFMWGTAATYKLQVMVPGGQGQVQAVQTHVLVRLGQLLCDFSASGATDSELSTIETTLQSLLASVTWAK